MRTKKTHTLRTRTDTLKFDVGTGRLISFRSAAAPGQEFIESSLDHPVCAIQWLDEQRQSRWMDSHSTRRIRVRCGKFGKGQRLTIECIGLGRKDLDLVGTVTVSPDDPMSRWTCALTNRAGVEIVDVQFPFVVARYQLGGKAGSETIVMPQSFGYLIREPTMQKLGPDGLACWDFAPRGMHTGWNHYPGVYFAQFMAYYNDRAGLYLAMNDTAGHVKRFKPIHREPGIRFGIAHVGDWPRRGRRALGYDVLLGSFTGDWWDAAGIYREWSLRQKWAVPLPQKKVPDWLTDSPVYITIRPQGILDTGPVHPVKEFLPYEKCLPILEKIARAVNAPLAVILMGWERAGSWVYPDCFPPVGGEKSMRNFIRRVRQRGWHAGSFCNGTRWVTSHNWNGYDGGEYFNRHDGRASVCRHPDGNLWADHWGWRDSYLQCSGTVKTRAVATDFVKHLISWGMDSIQFFDQNLGAATFPCFAKDHEHPPMPGKWMAAKMEQLLADFRNAAVEAKAPEVIHSVEMCTNEYSLPLFDESDSRLYPPGTVGCFGDAIPIYQFLFHECIVMHGMMGVAPEPYHLEIRNAFNGVMGEIPGAVMIGDGSLLAKNTDNWADWEPKVGNNDYALAMIRAVTELRRGAGKDFLVYGRMQRPCAISGVRMIKWKWQQCPYAIPAVFHGCWTAPDGRYAVALANWTDRPRRVTVQDARLEQGMLLHTAAKGVKSQSAPVRRHCLTVNLPPHSMVLVARAGEEKGEIGDGPKDNSLLEQVQQ